MVCSLKVLLGFQWSNIYETTPAPEVEVPVRTAAAKGIKEKKESESKLQLPEQASEPSREPEPQEIAQSHEEAERP